jgi:glycosyltransferase involved in cell wall biosynthesis
LKFLFLQEGIERDSQSISENNFVKPQVKPMPKTVTIDARWLVGGIGTYTRNLLQQFHQCANRFEIEAIVRRRDYGSVRHFCPSVTVVDTPIYTLREQWLVARASRRTDLLHVPHYNAPLLHRGPLVVSIMDVIHLSLPAQNRRLGAQLYAKPMLNAVARKADHVVTVSHFSKSEIVRTLGIPESKITVIPCGVSEEYCPPCGKGPQLPSVANELGIQGPFLLYVGNLKPHKNVATLLRAFAQLRHHKNPPHALVIVGDDSRWKPSIVQECQRLGIQDDTIFLPYVAQSLLPSVYAAASLLVMPSTIEGFGLPLLESMACGTPVVASRAASLPEVGGEAALYFDPASPEELAAQIERVLQSSQLRDSLRAKGIERAKQFSWQQAARKHAELYSQLLGLN